MPFAGRPTMLEFDRITITDIGRRFKGNTNECIRWCRRFGLLSNSPDLDVIFNANSYEFLIFSD